ncbi:GNAT family N-acetyltransferase [Pseudovibrio ascidiaceicola]|uniref:GNAT family N-acetyltransferase n=1 Tax=Pseudovibrio ascidiaceicola TaxID=285279 RepID=UPI001AD8D98B|nr:GNAT family N-acetyltransferase [Pseudovibrio ascidiaceicola]
MGNGQDLAQTLGVRSDLLVERSVSEVVVHPDRIVLRIPDEPHYWAGNMVFFRGDKVDPEQQIAQFRKDLPEAAHTMFGWDTPDMKIGPEHAPFSKLGYELEQIDVLSLTQPLNRAPTPDGINIRPIETEEDWKQVIALQIDTAVEQGYDRDSFGIYVSKRFESRRRQIKAGLANWFGAFDGDLLVADLGIYADAAVSRFQEVETRPSHRKRGICAALVTVGVDWAKAQAPATIPVLQAHSDGPAGRIYRRCGFEHRETLVLAILPPQGTFERPADTA